MKKPVVGEVTQLVRLSHPRAKKMLLNQNFLVVIHAYIDGFSQVFIQDVLWGAEAAAQW